MNKFCLKQLLLCIFCSILGTTFVGFSAIFIESVPQAISVEIIDTLENNGTYIDNIKEIGENYEIMFNEAIETNIKDDLDRFGEDYPTKGLFIWRLLNGTMSYAIIEFYLGAVILGIIIGTIMYIILVQKAKGKKLALEFVISIVIIVLLLYGIDLCYNFGMNKFIQSEIDVKEFIQYRADIFGGEYKSFAIWAFVIISVAVYCANIIYQGIIARKLNKELNK